jgi:predicted nucleic acid-binding Zn ribbon protein
MQKMSDDPLTECEKCGGSLRKVLHPVAIHFKGSGFYTTDYGKGSGRRAGTRDSDSGSTESGSTSGESASTSGESSSGDGDSAGSGKKTSSAGKSKETQKAT